MIKLKLRLLVLTRIKESEKSGYDLMKELSEILDSRPSSGQIYPLLHDLDSKGLIKVRVDGRRKLYSITAAGRKFLNSLSKNQDKAMEILAGHLEGISEKKEMEMFYRVHKSMEKHKEMMIRDMDVLWKLNQAIADIYDSKNSSARTKMRKILSRAAGELKRVL